MDWILSSLQLKVSLARFKIKITIMRNMAYTVTVSAVTPIEGKDRIQILSFKENGYNVIASKEIKVGDIVMYFEVDSILPVTDTFEFLRKRCYKEKLNGFLIKNMKMFNIYSNGLVMTQKELGIGFKESGVDYTDELKVRKYEPEDDASPKREKKGIMSFLYRHSLTRPIARLIASFQKQESKKEFPTHLIHKSDETNIQNMPKMFDVWKNKPCYITVKMEGQSVTITCEKELFGKYKIAVFGRNTVGKQQHYDFFEQEGIIKRVKKLAKELGYKSIAIQGEFCAPNVQGGIYKNGTHFYVYRINVNGKSENYHELCSHCEQLNMETVPLLGTYPLGYGAYYKDVAEIQDYVEHLWFKVGDPYVTVLSDYAKDVHRHEGIVVRSLDNTTFSFKVKSNEYQLSK